MKITTILKDIFLALASTLLFGGGIGFLGVWIFDAKISTMLHISVYIFLLILAMGCSSTTKTTIVPCA